MKKLLIICLISMLAVSVPAVSAHVTNDSLYFYHLGNDNEITLTCDHYYIHSIYYEYSDGTYEVVKLPVENPELGYPFPVNTKYIFTHSYTSDKDVNKIVVNFVLKRQWGFLYMETRYDKFYVDMTYYPYIDMDTCVKFKNGKADEIFVDLLGLKSFKFNETHEDGWFGEFYKEKIVNYN